MLAPFHRIQLSSNLSISSTGLVNVRRGRYVDGDLTFGSYEALFASAVAIGANGVATAPYLDNTATGAGWVAESVYVEIVTTSAGTGWVDVIQQSSPNAGASQWPDDKAGRCIGSIWVSGAGTYKGVFEAN